MERSLHVPARPTTERSRDRPGRRAPLAGCGTIRQAGGATAPGSDTGATSQPSGSQPSDGRLAERPAEQHSDRPTPVTLTANVKDGAKSVEGRHRGDGQGRATARSSKVKLTYTGKDGKGKTSRARSTER